MKNIFRDIALATDLREGSEGVRLIFATAADNTGIPLRGLARAVRLPLPVVAAVRREFEKRDVFERGGGVSLTEKGKLIADSMGFGKTASKETANSSDASSIPDDLAPMLEKLTAIQQQMPGVDVRLDQAFALPETSLRRALLASANRALGGRRVIFVGDDDLVSVACALLTSHLGATAGTELIVLDIDPRILELISAAASEHGLEIQTLLHDFREPLPAPLCNSFNTFFTDPPYTATGLRMFLSRAREALTVAPGMQGFLSFAHKDPAANMNLFATVNELGFYPEEVIPAFNNYEGAAIIGNSSRMIHLVCAGGEYSAPLQFEGPVYSGEVNVTRREYACAACGQKHKIGSGCRFETIEILKETGCSQCGEKKFRLRKKVQPPPVTG